MTCELPEELRKALLKQAKEYVKESAPEDELCYVYQLMTNAYYAASCAEVARSLKLFKALQRIHKWKFATDGRKFDGNHKEVLKTIISIAESALDEY